LPPALQFRRRQRLDNLPPGLGVAAALLVGGLPGLADQRGAGLAAGLHQSRLVGRRQIVEGLVVRYDDEGRGTEASRYFQMAVHQLVDTEAGHRLPWEQRSVDGAALDRFVHLGW